MQSHVRGLLCLLHIVQGEQDVHRFATEPTEASWEANIQMVSAVLSPECLLPEEKTRLSDVQM